LGSRESEKEGRRRYEKSERKKRIGGKGGRWYLKGKANERKEGRMEEKK
jgi:hypothetical protein